MVPHEQQVDLGGSPEEWAANEDLSIVSISAGLAEKLGTTVEEAIGKPLTRFLRLEENEDGELPLLVAATSRTDFNGQRARSRRGGEEVLVFVGRRSLRRTVALRASRAMRWARLHRP